MQVYVLPPPHMLTDYIEGHEETLKWTTLQIRVQMQSTNVPSEVDVGKINLMTFTSFTLRLSSAT